MEAGEKLIQIHSFTSIADQDAQLSTFTWNLGISFICGFRDHGGFGFMFIQTKLCDDSLPREGAWKDYTARYIT